MSERRETGQQLRLMQGGARARRPAMGVASRLDARTRRIGRHGIAEARQALAEAAPDAPGLKAG